MTEVDLGCGWLLVEETEERMAGVGAMQEPGSQPAATQVKLVLKMSDDRKCTGPGHQKMAEALYPQNSHPGLSWSRLPDTSGQVSRSAGGTTLRAQVREAFPQGARF